MAGAATASCREAGRAPTEAQPGPSHEVVPGVGRERAAVDLADATDVVIGTSAPDVAHPDRGLQLRGEPVEPGVDVVVGRPVLPATCRPDRPAAVPVPYWTTACRATVASSGDLRARRPAGPDCCPV